MSDNVVSWVWDDAIQPDSMLRQSLWYPRAFHSTPGCDGHLTSPTPWRFVHKTHFHSLELPRLSPSFFTHHHKLILYYPSSDHQATKQTILGPQLQLSTPTTTHHFRPLHHVEHNGSSSYPQQGSLTRPTRRRAVRSFASSHSNNAIGLYTPLPRRIHVGFGSSSWWDSISH